MKVTATTTIIILSATVASSLMPSSSSSKMLSLALLASTMVTLAEGEVKQFFLREPDNQTAIEGEQVKLFMKLKMITRFLKMTSRMILKLLERRRATMRLISKDHLVLMMTMTIKLGLLEILSHPATRRMIGQPCLSAPKI